MEFEDALSLEESYYKAGYEEGKEVGHVHGLIEGRIYGSEVAYERFQAVGQLRGRVSVWILQHSAEPRLMKHIQKVEALLDSIPLTNEETLAGQDYETLLALVISKMRIVSSLCSEESLVKQGLVEEGSRIKSAGDVEDGAEMAIRLRGGQQTSCSG